MKQWGNKVYVIAADYNYGQITAKWVDHYVKQRNGTAVKIEFFPLDVADFGSTIAKIQEAKPAFVCSALVGGAHMSFYLHLSAAARDYTGRGTSAARILIMPRLPCAVHPRLPDQQQRCLVSSKAGATAIPRALGDAFRRGHLRARDRGKKLPGNPVVCRGAQE